MRRKDLPLDTIDDNFFAYLVQYRNDYITATERVPFCFGGLSTARFWFNKLWPEGLHLTPENVVDTLEEIMEIADELDVHSDWEIAHRIDLIVLHANLSADVLSAIRESEDWWADEVDARDSVRIIKSHSRARTPS